MNTTSTLRRFAAVVALAGATAGLSGCGPIDALRSKDWLNTGVRDFNKGKYDDAEKSFSKALELNKDNGNAKLFYAMTLNAKFKRSPSEELGLKTIDAYKAVIDSESAFDRKDKAYAFIADVYNQLSELLDSTTDAAKVDEYKNKRREWLLSRNGLPEQVPATQAQMLYSVGQSYWQEAHDIIKAGQKAGATPQDKPTYELTPEQKTKAMELIGKGQEYMQQALAKNPEYADAYAYKKILFLEEAKITTDEAKVKELNDKAREAEETYRQKDSANKLREAAEADKAAAEAAEKGK